MRCTSEEKYKLVSEKLFESQAQEEDEEESLSSSFQRQLGVYDENFDTLEKRRAARSVADSVFHVTSGAAKICSNG